MEAPALLEPTLLPGAPTQLGGLRVELRWLAPRADPETSTAADRALLDAAERSRADRFRFERHRGAFVRRRAALRRLLGGLTGTDPAALVFVVGPYGKPAFAGGGPAFNLSRSGDAALFVTTPAGDVGVDLERAGRVRELDAVASRVFHPDELESWGRLPAAERDAAFTRLWTRKEAVLKATGEGLQREPSTFAVGLEPRPPGATRVLVLAPGIELELVDLQVPPPYRAALAVRLRSAR